MHRAHSLAAGLLLATLCACGGGGGSSRSGSNDLTGRWILTQAVAGIAGDPVHVTVNQLGSALTAVATCNDVWPVGTGSWDGISFTLTFDFESGGLLSLSGFASGADIVGTYTAATDGGTFTLVRTESALSCAEACDLRPLTPFVSRDVTDLEKIDRVSRFRSSAGADDADRCESCRSMHHAFAPFANHLVNGDIALHAPIAGQITRATIESHGASGATTNQRVEIRSSIHPEVTIVLPHVDLAVGVSTGRLVVPGDLIGTARLVFPELGETATSFDVAVRVHDVYGARTVSWFEVMTDSLFLHYTARGAVTRDDFIVSKAARDAEPLSCADGAFTTTGTISSWFALGHPPYLVRTAPGVVVQPLLTVGDSVNTKPDTTPYRMVGKPDGLGAFDNGDGTFTVLMNHELSNAEGVVRAHGSKGAFVSRWTFDKTTRKPLHGEDLAQSVGVFDGTTWNYGPVAFNRFCSADLPPISAFYNSQTGLGFDGRLYLNGEEAGTEGNAYAHAMDGTSYRLPWLGRFNWENALANPGTGDATIVVGTDDSATGQIYVYAGTKRSTGATPVDRAGLSNGVLFGVHVTGYGTEPAAGIPSGTAFTAFALGDVFVTTGATLQTTSRTNAVTEFNRPEDGCWDRNDPNTFYFATTASFTGRSRLWRLVFSDAANPALGGTIDMLLDGTEGQRMLDNICVTQAGRIFLQEDVGSQAHLGKIWRYDIATDVLIEIAHHSDDLFTTGLPGFLTISEESTGIIDVSDILGEGMFLVDVMAHYATDTELVEGGQLLLMYVPPSGP